MRVDISALPALAATFMLVFARIGAMVMLLPGFGETNIPTRIKLSIALLLTLIILPLHRTAYQVDMSSLTPLLVLMLHEIVVGIVLGATARVTLSALQVAGSVIAQQLGLGFVTAIEADVVPPGLSEDVIRLISQKKGEPEWMLEWRLRAYRQWLKMSEPRWANVQYGPIDYQAISYYAAPKKKPRLESLDQVDPKLLETFEKLGIPIEERKRLAGVAVDTELLKKQKASAVYANPGSYSRGGGYGWGGGGWGASYQPRTVYYQNNFQQVKAAQGVRIRQGSQTRLDIWKQIDDETSEIRRRMVGKYKVEF